MTRHCTTKRTMRKLLGMIKVRSLAGRIEDFVCQYSILKRRFIFIIKVCFYYRITSGSIIQPMTELHRDYLSRRVYDLMSIYITRFSVMLWVYMKFCNILNGNLHQIGWGKVFRKLKHFLCSYNETYDHRFLSLLQSA